MEGPCGPGENDEIWVVAKGYRDRDLELTDLWVTGELGVVVRDFGGSLKRMSLLTKVSHHPPISACHAESENFVFWQGEEGACGVDLRAKGRWGGADSGPVTDVPLPPRPNSRHEVEEQVLGEIAGDCTCGDSECQPAQVRARPRLGQGGTGQKGLA